LVLGERGFGVWEGSRTRSEEEELSRIATLIGRRGADIFVLKYDQE